MHTAQKEFANKTLDVRDNSGSTAAPTEVVIATSHFFAKRIELVRKFW